MSDLQERRRIKNFLFSPAVSVVLLIIIILLVRSNYNIYKTNQIAKINREESDKRLAILKEKADRLSAEIERLNTDRGIEDELRNKFQITKSGEEVLVVVDEVPPSEVSNEAVEDKNEGYWQKFISLLGF